MQSKPSQHIGFEAVLNALEALELLKDTTVLEEHMCHVSMSDTHYGRMHHGWTRY